MLSTTLPAALLMLTTATPDAGVRFDSRELIRDLFQPAEDPLPKMRALRDAATGPEKELLKRAVTTVEKMNADRDLNAHFLELVQLVRDLGALDPKSVDLQVSVAGSFLSFPMMAQTFRQDPEPLRKEALKRARALVSAFPKEARAHSVLGSALAENGASDLDVMKEYQACTKLDPALAHCRESHQRFAEAFRAPRCTGKNVKATLGAFAAYEQTLDGGVGRRVTQQGTSYQLATTPVLTAKDFASVIHEGDQLTLLTTPAGAKALESATTTLSVSRESLALMNGDALILVSRVFTAIPNGRVSLRPGSTDPRKVLEQLCTTIEVPKLPKELEP